jgi:cytochrome P450
MIPKHTDESYQQLTIASKSYIIPPRTYVIINMAGIHTNPAFWGSDSLEFRPDRFIVGDEIFQPPAGTYIPWTGGQRVCPGKKFAQVESAAVMARLFKEHRVRPKLMHGETAQMASDRIMEAVRDSILDIVIKLKHPEKIGLVWERKPKSASTQ